MPSATWTTRPVTPAILPDLSGRGGRGSGAVGPSPPDQAHAILRSAEQQAQALMEAARQKAASQVEAGYLEGRLQGQAEALAEARERLRELASALADAGERIRVLETEVRRQGAETIVRLALAVAERILQAEVARDPEAVLRTVRTALRLLPEPGAIQVRVHPAQHALLQAHQAQLLGETPGLASLVFQPDPGIAPGGCLVEAPGCLVDATIAAQLEEAGRRLRDGAA